MLGSDAMGLVADNDIFANSGANVLLGKGANPLVVNNRITQGRDVGVYVAR